VIEKNKRTINQNINILEELTRYFLLIAVFLLIVGFSIASPYFFNLNNFLDIIREASIIGLMGLGLTAAVAAGEFDFSVGATSTIAAVVAGKVLSFGSFDSVIVAFIIGILAALIVALINGFNVLKLGMPSFIATLGMATLLDGISKYFTGGAVFYSVNWPKGFGLLGKGFILKVIPIPALVFIIIAILSTIFLHRTTRGRYIFAVGNNPDAANHVGINCKKIKLLAFVVSSILTSIAGIIHGSMLGSISPLMGSANLLRAITTVMLGATFLTPGTPNMPGTFIAAIILAVVGNGLTMIGSSYFMKDVVTGIILIVAVGVIAVMKKGKLDQMITGL
jgi:ribose/xylose/arabinose/galactoside ABC-type transport system permease subunit